jgi:hypothetical protein
VAVAGSRELGLLALDPGSVVRGTDVVVADTLAATCVATTTCPLMEGGIGVSADYGGWVELTNFSVARSALCGVQVAGDGTMDLHRGEIVGSPIGANVQTPNFDLNRLADNVEYRENDRNLDTSAVYVPGPVGGL